MSLLDYPKLSNWYKRCKSLPGFLENQEGARHLSNELSRLIKEPLWFEESDNISIFELGRNFSSKNLLRDLK